MIFKLEEEEIKDIIESYGGSKKLINILEKRVIETCVVTDRDDYVELIESIILEHEVMKEKVSKCLDKHDRLNEYRSIDEIILSEINRKYDNLEDASYETKYNVQKTLTK